LHRVKYRPLPAYGALSPDREFDRVTLVVVAHARRGAPDRGQYRQAAGAVRSKRLDHLRLRLPAPANPSHCAKAGGEKPTGSNRAELPIPPFWSEARLAIRAAPEIRFVIPRQLRIALRELSPIASLCARSHAVLGPQKCLVETDPPRPTRLRRSKRRVRRNQESSWRWPMQTGCPFTSSS
jgi:hypothetical protein